MYFSTLLHSIIHFPAYLDKAQEALKVLMYPLDACLDTIS